MTTQKDHPFSKFNQVFNPKTEGIRKDIAIAKRKKEFYDKLKKVVPATGIIFFVIMLLLYFLLQHNMLFLGIGIFYFFVAIIYPIFNLGNTINTEIEALQSELILNITGTEAIEQRAERLFKSHEIELRRYYNQALNHSTTIFITGIVCVIIGFCIIGITFYLINNLTNSANLPSTSSVDFSDKIIIALMGIISGILTNFIGLIFLKIFSESTKSLRTFHKKLVSTNHLHFANFLVSKINDIKMRDQTINEISKIIVTEM